MQSTDETAGNSDQAPPPIPPSPASPEHIPVAATWPGPAQTYGYYAPPGPAAPASIAVLGWFGAIIGGLGILMDLFTGAVNLVTLSSGGRNPFAPSAPPTSLAAVRLTVALVPFSLALSVWLLLASISLLRQREQGRVWAIRWAWARLAWMVPSISVGTWVTFRAMRDTQQQLGPMKDIMVPMMVVSILFGLVLVSALPVCMLIFLRRPEVKAACAATLQPRPN